jgi:hypothetical protein
LGSCFPTRRPIGCPSCGKAASLPLRAVLFGVVGMLFVISVAIGFWKKSGLDRADTAGTILLSAVAILAMILLATNLSCRFTRIFVDRLDRLR